MFFVTVHFYFTRFVIVRDNSRDSEKYNKMVRSERFCCNSFVYNNITIFGYKTFDLLNVIDKQNRLFFM